MVAQRIPCLKPSTFNHSQRTLWYQNAGTFIIKPLHLLCTLSLTRYLKELANE